MTINEFIMRTRSVVDNPNIECIGWTEDGAFILVDHEGFQKGPLQMVCKTDRYDSWTATLSRYDFKCYSHYHFNSPNERTHVYYHEKFQRDFPDLMNDLKRRSNKRKACDTDDASPSPPSVPTDAVAVPAARERPFIERLVGILEELEMQDAVAWVEDGDGFVVKNLNALATRMWQKQYGSDMPGYPQTASLVRQFCDYGFVSKKKSNIYRHSLSLFHRDHPDKRLCIVRKKRPKSNPKPQSTRTLAADGLLDLVTARDGGVEGESALVE